MIKPGDQAPEFELPDQDGSAVKLADFRGQRVVLYFYPKADTRGANCGIRLMALDRAEGAPSFALADQDGHAVRCRSCDGRAVGTFRTAIRIGAKPTRRARPGRASASATRM